MDRVKETGSGKAGEAGHSGYDRQPAGDGVKVVKGGTPDAGEAATAGEVKSRSEEAGGMKQPQHEGADKVGPGSGRKAAEKGRKSEGL